MKVTELQSYPPYYRDLYSKIPQNESLHSLLKIRSNGLEFYHEIPEFMYRHSYTEGKWSIQRVLRHILDAELIFNYRALSIVRGERRPLMSWDENAYANEIKDEQLQKEALLTSLELQIRYTENLFLSFTPADLHKRGHANGYEMEVAAIGFAILAHEKHHCTVIQDRYLNAT